MKKIIPFLLFIVLAAGCAKKEWSKSYLSKKCGREMSKNKEASGLISKENMDKICDCAADKMMMKYKSEAEANKDEAGAQQIGRDCAMEVMMGGNQENQ